MAFQLYYRLPIVGGLFRRPMKFLDLYTFAQALLTGTAVTLGVEDAVAGAQIFPEATVVTRAPRAAVDRVQGARRTGVPKLPPCRVRAGRPLDILVIREEVIVERTDGPECRASQEQRASWNPGDGALAGVAAVIRRILAHQGDQALEPRDPPPRHPQRRGPVGAQHLAPHGGRGRMSDAVSIRRESVSGSTSASLLRIHTKSAPRSRAMRMPTLLPPA